jgi:hypothetical protein
MQEELPPCPLESARGGGEEHRKTGQQLAEITGGRRARDPKRQNDECIDGVSDAQSQGNRTIGRPDLQLLDTGGARDDVRHTRQFREDDIERDIRAKRAEGAVAATTPLIKTRYCQRQTRNGARVATGFSSMDAAGRQPRRVPSSAT